MNFSLPDHVLAPTIWVCCKRIDARALKEVRYVLIRSFVCMKLKNILYKYYIKVFQNIAFILTGCFIGESMGKAERYPNQLPLTFHGPRFEAVQLIEAFIYDNYINCDTKIFMDQDIIVDNKN